ncbi:insecticidal delta-endotoxin Cry8Ea1 family protein [Bacillus mycoides]|uniref:insecticidal delta-endotoxin Cry8Ea1 family protein n=1 Tax=Bacillus mycoides TaxID=1405 RepID=UPI003D016372
MNPYNNEGYEIIDSNTSPYPSNRNNSYSNSRYPYANNPNQPMQHTNYKDSMNSSQNSQPYNGCIPNDSSSLTWSSGASTALIVVGTIILGSIAPVTIPVGIGTVLVSVGTLLPILWPEGTTNTNSVWKDLISQGNNISCESASTIESIILTRVDELEIYLKNYKTALENWKKEKNKNTTDEVAYQFRNAASQMLAAMPTFSMKGYEVVSLSSYAQAAVLHLTLLYEGIQYANEWSLGFNAGDFYRNQLMEAIKIYINHCEKWYKEGLNQLYNTPNIRWEDYNNYRKEYTISVLNVISTFPRFDMNLYSPDVAVQLEFTQQLFTPSPELKGITSGSNINYLENMLIPSLDLVTFLRQIRFYTIRDETAFGVYYLDSIQNTLQYTNDQNTHNKRYGNTYNQLSYQDIYIDSNQTIYFCDSIYHATKNLNEERAIRGIKYMEMKVKIKNSNGTTSGSYLSYDSGSLSQDSTIRTFLPFPPNVKLQSLANNEYILSRITMSNFPLDGPFSSYTYIYGFIWTHSTVNLTNQISNKNKDGLRIITQISAVKANKIGNYNNQVNTVSIINGPGHTGGNLIKFTTFQDYIRLNCEFKNTEITKYILRIRYASSNTGDIGISINYNTTQKFNIENTQINRQGEPLIYQNFKYVNTIIHTSKSASEDVDIEIINSTQSATIIIDKIEFIPQ